MYKILAKNDIQASDWEYEFQQRGEQPILLSDWYCRGIINYFQSSFDLPISATDYVFTDSHKGYVNEKKKADLLLKQKERLQNREYIEYVLLGATGIPKEFEKVAEKIIEETRDSQVTNEQLAVLWEEMSKSFEKLMPWFWVPYYPSTENMLTDKVRVGLQKYEKQIEGITDINDALLVLVFPVKEVLFQQEQKDFFELVSIAHGDREYVTNEKFKALAERYLTKYDWVTTFLLMPLEVLSYEALIERIVVALQENFIENFTLQQKSKRENEEKARRLMTLFAENDGLISHIHDAQELGFVLTSGIEITLSASARLLSFIRLVSVRLNIPYRSIRLLLSHEIVSALTSEFAVTSELLNEREKGYIMMVKDGEQYVTFGKKGGELSTWFDSEMNVVKEGITELHGQVACRGNVQGIVRVALSPSGSHALLPGEILVCPMTNPDYVHAMRRAGAIVTDEGGLLSHAAIMSREFGVPCVIATQIATQVLKDGDIVEVDADHGAVRILERAK